MDIKKIALYGGGGLILLSLLTSQEQISQNAATANQLKGLQTQAAVESEKQQVALQRQQSGRCVFVVAPGTTQPTAVRDGVRIVDESQGATLGEGAYGCDVWGGTVVIGPDGRGHSYAQGPAIASTMPQPQSTPTPEEPIHEAQAQ